MIKRFPRSLFKVACDACLRTQNEGRWRDERERTREEWTAIFEPTDACVTPVLSMREAPRHPHNEARSTSPDFEGHPIPVPAPRFGEGIAPLATPSRLISVDAALERWREQRHRTR